MTRYRVSSDVRWAERNSVFYALHLSSGKYVVLRDTGAFVMSGIGQKQQPENIAEALSAEYGVSRDEALRDVREMITELSSGGFLSIDD